MKLCDFSPASEDFADFIVRYPARSPWQMPDQKDRRCFNYVSRDFAIFHLPLEQALPLTLSRYSYENIPKLYGLQDTTALEVSGISPVFEQPALNAAGRGVLIGFIDTGIDYTNPLFRKADGTPCKQPCKIQTHTGIFHSRSSSSITGISFLLIRWLATPGKTGADRSHPDAKEDFCEENKEACAAGAAAPDDPDRKSVV